MNQQMDTCIYILYFFKKKIYIYIHMHIYRNGHTYIATYQHMYIYIYLHNMYIQRLQIRILHQVGWAELSLGTCAVILGGSPHHGSAEAVRKAFLFFYAGITTHRPIGFCANMVLRSLASEACLKSQKRLLKNCPRAQVGVTGELTTFHLPTASQVISLADTVCCAWHEAAELDPNPELSRYLCLVAQSRSLMS